MSDLEDQNEERKTYFDRRITLGNILTMGGLALTMFLSYTQVIAWKSATETRLTSIEAKLNLYDQQNLPPRVSSLEAQTRSITGGMHDIHQDLLNILTTLNTKQDKR